DRRGREQVEDEEARRAEGALDLAAHGEQEARRDEELERRPVEEDVRDDRPGPARDRGEVADAERVERVLHGLLGEGEEDGESDAVQDEQQLEGVDRACEGLPRARPARDPIGHLALRAPMKPLRGTIAPATGACSASSNRAVRPTSPAALPLMMER